MRIQKPADIARIAKTRRQARGLSQQDVADAVGITRQSLARIERGHGGASIDTVLRIFAELGVHLDASRDDQHDVTTPEFDIETLSHDTPAALAATRNIDTTVITAALVSATRSIDTSGLTASATPTTWKTVLDDLTDQVQRAAVRGGSVPSAKEARQALLDSVIEAGDPDRRIPTTADDLNSRARSDGDING